jgi:hypothetical protein
MESIINEQSMIEDSEDEENYCIKILYYLKDGTEVSTIIINFKFVFYYFKSN